MNILTKELNKKTSVNWTGDYMLMSKQVTEFIFWSSWQTWVTVPGQGVGPAVLSCLGGEVSRQHQLQPCPFPGGSCSHSTLDEGSWEAAPEPPQFAPSSASTEAVQLFLIPCSHAQLGTLSPSPAVLLCSTVTAVQWWMYLCFILKSAFRFRQEIQQIPETSYPFGKMGEPLV